MSVITVSYTPQFSTMYPVDHGDGKLAKDIPRDLITHIANTHRYINAAADSIFFHNYVYALMMILNLIYGLLVTIIVLVIWVLNCITEPMRRGAKSRPVTMGSALDEMAGILGGVAEQTSRDQVQNEQVHNGQLHNGQVHGGAPAVTPLPRSVMPVVDATPDFPIADPELKAAYTRAFTEVYGTEEKPPVVKYSDIGGSLRYVEKQVLPTAAYHIGQRKLILNEIQFLTQVEPGSLVVYAGAAPSNKGAMLAGLFPGLKFFLIDPAKFDIRPYAGVTVHHLDVTDRDEPGAIVDAALSALGSANVCTARVYMSSGIATAVGQKSAAYFMSDIRTNMVSDGPMTLDILWNSAQHIQWVDLMKPRATMLKFRVPFFNESPDLLREYEQLSHTAPYAEAFDYVARVHRKSLRTFTTGEFWSPTGEIYLQPWAPVQSAETRLVFNGPPKLVQYYLSEYEDRMFYYNMILRNYQLYQNPYADRKLGFDHCADCALEAVIWAEYCTRRGIPLTAIPKFVKELSDITYRPLAHGNHGRAFSPLPMHLVMKRFEDRYRK